MSTKNKKRIAVFFGGRSPEHDVSVITGLQAFSAIDVSEFEPFPVYVSPQGEWYVGDALKDMSNYIFDEEKISQLTPVQLDLSAKGMGVLVPKKKSFMRAKTEIIFDVAFCAFHGLNGEDGTFQGMMEFANVPYTGMRSKASSVFMDKDTTKKALSGTSIPLLPHAVVLRPEVGLLVDHECLEAFMGPIGFPCCVKPARLGSSIGVGKASTMEEVRSILSALFQFDEKAIIEPYIENLVEYNISLRVNSAREVETSAIERPKTDKELLDFKDKYMGDDGGKKGGSKSGGAISEGLLALTREINPDLTQEIQDKIRSYAVDVFNRFDPSGIPRIDFISDSKTGEIWFNELNPMPGSCGYFLWEASDKNILFTELLTGLIYEAEYFYKRQQIPHDPVPKDAQLFKRSI